MAEVKQLTVILNADDIRNCAVALTEHVKRQVNEFITENKFNQKVSRNADEIIKIVHIAIIAKLINFQNSVQELRILNDFVLQLTLNHID